MRKDQQKHEGSSEHKCDKNVHGILVVKVYKSRIYVRNCGSLVMD